MLPIPPRFASFLSSKKGGLLLQAALFLSFAYFLHAIYSNAAGNIKEQGIAFGLDFWGQTAGFRIDQSLIDYEITSTYGRAFFVGLINTLLVSCMSILLATFLGVFVGVGRTSKNYVVKIFCGSYVDVFRNIPLILILLFFYNGIFATLPPVRESTKIFDGMFLLNNRGLFLPEIAVQPAVSGALIAAFIALVALVVALFNMKQDSAPRYSNLIFIASTLLAFFLWFAYVNKDAPLVTFSSPELSRFNINGGKRIFPEFLALWLGLSVYMSSFIAETVRSGIEAIPNGQIEAAKSFGFSNIRILKLIIFPQALRVIIPPLINQYLNITKNSSLAVAIGYQELVQIFMGTVLNQTGQAVEIVTITMLVYLLISLLTSFFMNWYNARNLFTT